MFFSRDALSIRTTLSLVVIATLTGVCFPSTAVAQRESLPVNLPDGPAKDGFDIERFSNMGNGFFETFYVERTESLQDVLTQGRVAGDTPVVVLETAAGPLALLNDQIVYHHIAEGRAGGKDWMATF
jgi:hypothetical protein